MLTYLSEDILLIPEDELSSDLSSLYELFELYESELILELEDDSELWMSVVVATPKNFLQFYEPQ